eukprot:2238645-Alexandrium_andersonii.AAC.1
MPPCAPCNPSRELRAPTLRSSRSHSGVQQPDPGGSAIRAREFRKRRSGCLLYTSDAADDM